MAQDPNLRPLDAQLAALTWGEFQEFRPQIERCFEAMQSMDDNPDRAINEAAICLAAIWTNYVDAETAEIFRAFASVQRALFGLELEEGGPRRYREHVLHMFNVYILGASLLSPLATIPDAEARDVALREVLKIVPERDQISDWSGRWKPYDAQKRLFYLWTLMSTFHDIGIPVEHLPKMRDGLNRYLDYCGRDLAELLTHLEPAVTSQLQYYFGLMGRLFGTRVQLDSERPGLYAQGDIHPYLYKTLADALGGDQPDHGVVSALCLYRSLERAFMKDRTEYNLTLDQFPQYVEFVLEQDVTRAALAISLHNLDPADYPKLFPLSFPNFPLTYLLLLADELQEFYRFEGLSPLGVVPLPRLPEVSATYSDGRLRGEIRYLYTPPPHDKWEIIKRSADAFAKKMNWKSYETHADLVSRLWVYTTTKIRKKLLSARRNLFTFV